MITVMNPKMAIIQNRTLGFYSDKNPAKIAVESGTAARTMPPFPAGIVCIATAVKIGNPKTTPIAVMTNLVKFDLCGSFSNLRWPLNKRIRREARPAIKPLPKPISRDVNPVWAKCLVIGKVDEKIITPINPSKKP
jgi:hypothetical protein